MKLSRLRRDVLCLIGAAWLLGLGQTLAFEPVRLHPANGHYFLYRDRPVVLMGSTEHYGALINLDFDYIRYFEEVRTTDLNLVRVFSGAYIEVPGEFGIADNTLVPSAGRSIFPWKRTNIPGAGDGGTKFDLNQWDPAYFHRLRDLVTEADKRGIVVEFTFFSAIPASSSALGTEAVWNICPMNAANHVNSVGAGGRRQAYQPSGDLLPYQKALARKIATELKGFDNVILEIINEPYNHNISEGPNPGTNAPPYLPSDPFYQNRTLAWENLIIDELVATQAGFPHQLMIARNVANFQFTMSGIHPAVSLYNFHYAKPNAAALNYQFNRAIGNDETGFAGEQDLPYRSEAWEFMLAGGGLVNHLDYSFTTTREDGGAGISAIPNQPIPGGGGPAIRHQLALLRWFLEELPLLELVPQPSLVTGGIPANGAARAIGKPGVAYGIYVRGGSQANLILNLPAESYAGRWIDARSGLLLEAVEVPSHPGGQVTLNSPTYQGDIVLRLDAINQQPPWVELTTPVYNMVVGKNTQSVTVKAEASLTGGTLAHVEFFDGETPLGVDTEAPYEITLNLPNPGFHVYRARAVATDGRKAFSPPVKFTVEGPFALGVNLNGSPLVVGGQQMISEVQAVSNGLVLGNAQRASTTTSSPIFPAADPTTELLLKDHFVRANANLNQALTIVYPLPNGYYKVFIYTSENQAGFSRDMRVILENQTVARGIGDIALGEWRKYGPYKTQVTDGFLNLNLTQDTKGVPKIAGFAVYETAPPPAFSDTSLDIRISDGMPVLSYPSGLPPVRIEFTDNLSLPGSWQDFPGAVFDFTERFQIPAPIVGESRFFRLRKD